MAEKVSSKWNEKYFMCIQLWLYYSGNFSTFTSKIYYPVVLTSYPVQQGYLISNGFSCFKVFTKTMKIYCFQNLQKKHCRKKWKCQQIKVEIKNENISYFFVCYCKPTNQSSYLTSFLLSPNTLYIDTQIFNSAVRKERERRRTSYQCSWHEKGLRGTKFIPLVFYE